MAKREKGNVENKVGCHRRNLFVPVPSFHDVASFNERLLQGCLDLSEGKRHYRLGTVKVNPGSTDRDCGGNLGPNPSYAASRPKSLRYCMGLL